LATLNYPFTALTADLPRIFGESNCKASGADASKPRVQKITMPDHLLRTFAPPLEQDARAAQKRSGAWRK
jgi:hypothetical protein